MFLKLYSIILVAIHVLQVVYSLTVVLSPPLVEVIENSSVTLTCSDDGTGDTKGSTWGRTSSSVRAYMNLAADGSCLATGFINDSYLYDWSCYKNNTFSLTLKNVSRSENGEEWKCWMQFPGSNPCTIFVKVPVESAKITSHLDEKVSIKENSSATLKCNTGPSRPIPTISWFLSDPDTNSSINITDASSQSPQAGDSLIFTEVESELTNTFNRSHNGSNVYCMASNLPNRSVKSSSKLLFIIYPPDGAPTLTGIHDGGVLSIVEYQQGKVSCTVNGGNPPANLTWHCFNGNVTESHKKGKVISNITWTALRKQHNKSCTCMSEHILGDLSASFSVKVLYTPDIPTLSIISNSTEKIVEDIIEVIQNNSLNVVCTTESNPKSDYKWTKVSHLIRKGQILTINRTQKQDSGEYECNVNNTIGSNGFVTDGRNSSKITLHILFPPNNPTFRYIDNTSNESVNDSVIYIILGDEFKITCQSVGHPAPDYSWENYDTGNTSIIIAGNSVNKTCTATNTMTETFGVSRKGSASSTLFFDVLYAPTAPRITIHNNTRLKLNVSESIRVIEKTSFNLSCTSDGNPIPIYEWQVNRSELSTDQELVEMNISRHQSGQYTCIASNTMIRTFGKEEIGSNISNITVDVLYPAEVGDLTDITKVEGSSINVTCPVIFGNPPEATVKWTPGGDVGSSDSSWLYINNISRKDEKLYKCSVTTLMTPTYGLQKEEIYYGQFQMTVYYKARVTEFYIGAKADKDVYTVNETEDVTFTCSIDSKPAPTATILLNNETVHISDNSSFTYRRENIQCVDFGLYQCTGINEYNYGSQSVMNLMLYVKCSPRPSTDFELNTNLTSARNTTAVFSFTALAYPEPGPAGFIWSHINESDKIVLTNSSSVFIINTDIQSNLTITNVTLESYGQYMLRINNTMGVFEQSFLLKPLDVPMAPAISNWTSGEAHITISVKAGFDGGLIQWFYLKYKKLSEEGWISAHMVNTTSKEFNYTINGLSSGQSYQLMLFAGNIKGNSTNVFITVDTKEYKGTATGRDNSSSTTAAVAGSTSVVVAVIVAMVIAGLLYKKRRHDNDTGKLLYQNIPFTGNAKNKKNKCGQTKIEETPFGCLQEIDDAPMVTKEQVEYYNSQDVLETIDKIKVSELFSYLIGKSEDSFGIDYQKLPTGLEKPCTFARKPENLAKNRYNGIYPYDHSRVKLHGDPDFFINACYIDGYKRTKAYIASLGPTAKTTSDFITFWQMIWHEQSDIIVMLTNLREPSGMKCEKYWPDHGGSECYGDITVTGQTIEIFAEYTVRIFSVLKDDESRTVTHLHYTAWPDKKVPEDTMSLLEFRQRIKITPTLSGGPVVVHCSAGIGRTGTLIALDRLIEEGQCEGSVNVYECVLSMREQRVKMVQTLEQYIYIYKALVSALVFDSEIIPLESYEEYMDTTSIITYKYQFQQLQQSVDTESKEEIESRTVNAARTTQNRSGADIPAAHSRVFLYLNRNEDDSDYINAVYVNSFKRKDYFIVAQSPLINTVVDFICMLYQEDCTCIVSMEDMKEPGTSVGVYLPSDGHTLKFGQFIVSCTRLEMSHHCIVRKVIIKLNGKNENGEKTFYHFQYTNWMSGHDCPMNASEFVQFVTEVEEYANQFCEERSHVLVHCLKANERSGLFCAVTTLIEKLKYERQVNVLNTLRHIRTRRKTSITSMEQLKFCYQTGSVYIKMFRP